MTTSPQDRAAEAFATELARWRIQRGLSEQQPATLSYVDGVYHCTVQRALYNAGPEPVIRYPVRIAVDRYPSEPERSNRLYREHPLTWEELNLTATFGTAPGERMRLRPIY